jgi:eukaryotic-like serine/threonine-protein kinase
LREIVPDILDGVTRQHDLTDVVLDGRYQVIAPLSEGAMGCVFRAQRVGLGREVAVKMMHTALPGSLAARERFERESKLMAKLVHPNTVSVIDFGVYDERPYLVMELVAGVSLQDLIARDGRLPLRRASNIACQLLAGVAHAHAQEIIHRDIKPANIMVSTKEALGDHVQILDFGLARLLESSSLLTQGFTVGTPSYMAPEQCRGAPIDPRIDVYACGAVLFEMIAGHKPFIASDPLEVVKMHLHEPPPRLEGPLEDVVARALAKDPDDRFASATEMADAIVAAVPNARLASQPVIPTLGSSALVPVDEPSSVAEPSVPSVLMRPPLSRMRWAALFIALLVGASIYGIIRAKQYLAQQAAETTG